MLSLVTVGAAASPPVQFSFRLLNMYVQFVAWAHGLANLAGLQCEFVWNVRWFIVNARHKDISYHGCRCRVRRCRNCEMCLFGWLNENTKTKQKISANFHFIRLICGSTRIHFSFYVFVVVARAVFETLTVLTELTDAPRSYLLIHLMSMSRDALALAQQFSHPYSIDVTRLSPIITTIWQ